MKISTSQTAILAVAPIGFSLEHDKKSMPSKYPSQLTGEVGLKRKSKSEFCLPEKINGTASAKTNKSVNKSANLCFGGFFNAQKIYKSNLLKKGLEFASDNGALFAAGVALGTTVLLRPFAIFATPGVKKENKEYACAKSIASGVIGFGVMALLSTPIAQAIKKINNNPAKFLKKETIKALSSGKELTKSAKYKLSTQLFKIGADFISAIPKALLTCALIPPIMLLLFPKRDKQSSDIVYFKSGSIDNLSKQIFKGFINKGQKS